ncbi:MAG: hypothetical protein QF570_14055 [Myxococcota bacterium]|jgi:hypothetical protein|nr:hypothetical protein [Myxococcota bacterium]
MNPSSRVAATGAAIYWGFVFALVVGVFVAPAFPSQDGPIHLYNFGLIESLTSVDAERGEVFRFDITSPTNLGLPLFGSLLMRGLPGWLVERLLVALHVLALAWFCVAWRRAQGREPFPAAYAGLAFCLPWSLFMGFYSFQLASDLALVALVWGWRWRGRPLSFLAPVMGIAGAAVLFVHAVPAALLAVLLAVMLAIGNGADADQRIPLHFGRAIVVALPIALIVLWAISGTRAETGGEWRWQSASYVLVYLATFGTFVYEGQLLPALVVCGVFVSLCVTGRSAREPAGEPSRTHFVWCAAAVLAVLHLVLPDVVGGGGYLTGRFAWWIPLLLLPAIECNEGRLLGVEKRLLPPALAVLGLGATILLAAPSAMRVAEVQTAAAANPVEGSVSAAIFDRDPRSTANLEPLRHVVAWFAMERGIVTTNYQARERFFPIRLTTQATRSLPDIDINAAWETDWAKLPLDALLAIDANEADRSRLARSFDSVWLDSRKRVELWRRK